MRILRRCLPIFAFLVLSLHPRYRFSDHVHGQQTLHHGNQHLLLDDQRRNIARKSYHVNRG